MFAEQNIWLKSNRTSAVSVDAVVAHRTAAEAAAEARRPVIKVTAVIAASVTYLVYIEAVAYILGAGHHSFGANRVDGSAVMPLSGRAPANRSVHLWL